MIDSSIGGKTGVDGPAGKNLLGAFHQPRLVVTDLEVLGTLPPVQLTAGMAEALKHAVIADAEYFALLEREGRGGGGGGGGGAGGGASGLWGGVAPGPGSTTRRRRPAPGGGRRRERCAS